MVVIVVLLLLGGGLVVSRFKRHARRAQAVREARELLLRKKADRDRVGARPVPVVVAGAAGSRVRLGTYSMERGGRLPGPWLRIDPALELQTPEGAPCALEPDAYLQVLGVAGIHEESLGVERIDTVWGLEIPAGTELLILAVPERRDAPSPYRGGQLHLLPVEGCYRAAAPSSAELLFDPIPAEPRWYEPLSALLWISLALVVLPRLGPVWGTVAAALVGLVGALVELLGWMTVDEA